MRAGWTISEIGDLLAPMEDGRTLHHGWSPQCETVPSPTEQDWGVLKTTAVQAGRFLPHENKLLPDHLSPREHLEVREGDILLTCAGPRARCGVPCLVKHTRKRLILSGKMYRMRPNTARVDPRYLEAFLQSPQAQDAIDRMKTGISDSGLNLTHDRFKRLLVPLAPRGDQPEIADEVEAEFSRIDAGVAALKRVRANLKRYRAAVLKAACEGQLVPTEAELARPEGREYETGAQLLERILAERRANWDRRGKYKEPAAPQTEELADLPDGWMWATVEQVGDVQLGRQRSPKNVSHEFPTMYIRAANITESGLSVDDVLDMEFRPSERERYRLQYGDIVLSEASGSPEQVGKPAIWRDELPLCCFQNTVIRHRPRIIGPSFLHLAYRSYYVSKVFARIAGGIGINHLGAEKFSVIPIPVPPLAEQERIVAEVERRLSVVEEIEAAVEAGLKRAGRLRQAVLQKAFGR